MTGLKKTPQERTFLFGFECIGADEVAITAPTEKEARERAIEAWKACPGNKPKIVYCIETKNPRWHYG
jgi:hypothetical protein